MNEIIQDLINTGEVVSFINNVIVETKKEKGHNKVVKETIKRLVKNDLKLYAQALKINVEDVICIKDTFPTTSPKKITEINNIINKSSLVKLKIKMTRKKPLRKQVIVFKTQVVFLHYLQEPDHLFFQFFHYLCWYYKVVHVVCQYAFMK